MEEKEEEIIEVYIPDSPDVKDFHSMPSHDKIMTIKLGLIMMKYGSEKLLCWKNDKWKDELNKIKDTQNDEILELTSQLQAAERDYKAHIAISQQRQDSLIAEVKQNEKARLQNEIEDLRNNNQTLISRIDNLNSTLDAKYNTRLNENRDFYENKLNVLQEKYTTLLSRGQNSTLKGKEGEEFIQGKLNMLFPQAEIEDTHSIPHRGDFIVREDDFNMMIENKNYSRNVQKSEIDKFYNDIDNPANSDIQCAVLVSLNTGICSKHDFCFEIRNMIPILFIHKLQNNFENLKLAAKFFKLITSQNGVDLSNKEVIDHFRNLASTIKRNFNKQKTRLDKFHTEQLELVAEQECKISELYALVKQKF